MKTFGILCAALLISAAVVACLLAISTKPTRLTEVANGAASAYEQQTGLTCSNPDAAILGRTKSTFSLYLVCDEGKFIVDYDGTTATIQGAT